MLEIDNQAIAGAILEGFTMIWEGLGKPLIETILNFFIQVATSDPVGDIALVFALVSLIIGALGLAFRWAVKQVNNPY